MEKILKILLGKKNTVIILTKKNIKTILLNHQMVSIGEFKDAKNDYYNSVPIFLMGDYGDSVSIDSLGAVISKRHARACDNQPLDGRQRRHVRGRGSLALTGKRPRTLGFFHARLLPLSRILLFLCGNRAGVWENGGALHSGQATGLAPGSLRLEGH